MGSGGAPVSDNQQRLNNQIANWLWTAVTPGSEQTGISGAQPQNYGQLGQIITQLFSLPQYSGQMAAGLTPGMISADQLSQLGLNLFGGVNGTAGGATGGTASGTGAPPAPPPPPGVTTIPYNPIPSIAADASKGGGGVASTQFSTQPVPGGTPTGGVFGNIQQVLNGLSASLGGQQYLPPEAQQLISNLPGGTTLASLASGQGAGSQTLQQLAMGTQSPYTQQLANLAQQPTNLNALQGLLGGGAGQNQGLNQLLSMAQGQGPGSMQLQNLALGSQVPYAQNILGLAGQGIDTSALSSMLSGGLGQNQGLSSLLGMTNGQVNTSGLSNLLNGGLGQNQGLNSLLGMTNGQVDTSGLSALLNGGLGQNQGLSQLLGLAQGGALPYASQLQQVAGQTPDTGALSNMLATGGGANQGLNQLLGLGTGPVANGLASLASQGVNTSALQSMLAPGGLGANQGLSQLLGLGTAQAGGQQPLSNIAGLAPGITQQAAGALGQVATGATPDYQSVFNAMQNVANTQLAQNQRDLREQFSASGNRFSTDLAGALGQAQTNSLQALASQMGQLGLQAAGQQMGAQVGAGQALANLGLGAATGLSQAGLTGQGQNIQAAGQAGGLTAQQQALLGQLATAAPQIGLQQQANQGNILSSLLGQQVGAAGTAGGLTAQQQALMGQLSTALPQIGLQSQAQQGNILSSLLSGGLQQQGQQITAAGQAGQLTSAQQALMSQIAQAIPGLQLQQQGQNISAAGQAGQLTSAQQSLVSQLAQAIPGLQLQQQGQNISAAGQAATVGGQNQALLAQIAQAIPSLGLQQQSQAGNLLTALMGGGLQAQGQQATAAQALAQNALGAAGQAATTTGASQALQAQIAQALGSLGLQGQSQQMGALGTLLSTGLQGQSQQAAAAQALQGTALQAAGQQATSGTNLASILSGAYGNQQGLNLQALLGSPGALSSLAMLPQQVAGAAMTNQQPIQATQQNALTQAYNNYASTAAALFGPLLGYGGGTPVIPSTYPLIGGTK